MVLPGMLYLGYSHYLTDPAANGRYLDKTHARTGKQLDRQHSQRLGETLTILHTARDAYETVHMRTVLHATALNPPHMRIL